jgi:hypothetical protein
MIFYSYNKMEGSNEEMEKYEKGFNFLCCFFKSYFLEKTKTMIRKCMKFYKKLGFVFFITFNLNVYCPKSVFANQQFRSGSYRSETVVLDNIPENREDNLVIRKNETKKQKQIIVKCTKKTGPKQIGLLSEQQLVLKENGFRKFEVTLPPAKLSKNKVNIEILKLLKLNNDIKKIQREEFLSEFSNHILIVASNNLRKTEKIENFQKEEKFAVLKTKLMEHGNKYFTQTLFEPKYLDANIENKYIQPEYKKSKLISYIGGKLPLNLNLEDERTIRSVMNGRTVNALIKDLDMIIYVYKQKYNNFTRNFLFICQMSMRYNLFLKYEKILFSQVQKIYKLSMLIQELELKKFYAIMLRHFCKQVRGNYLKLTKTPLQILWSKLLYYYSIVEIWIRLYIFSFLRCFQNYLLFLTFIFAIIKKQYIYKAIKSLKIYFEELKSKKFFEGKKKN